ncbi:MAG TPA: hypothetical protein DCY13_18095 [Verrucomicrobiales bacterium]|nr:hypothetical protein [Verrucomicrobiales bacterium]
MKLRFFRSFLTISAILAMALSATHAADTGTVNEDTVNIRGRAGFIGEVITRVSRGDTVTILEEVRLASPKPGEPADWLRIALPANTPVWIHTSYIDPATQTITASRLKVRGGPSINHSVLGFIPQGTAVRPIRAQGEWTEIEPVSDLHAFIAASMVTRSGAPAEAVATTAPVTTPETTPDLAEAPAVTTPEVTTPVPQPVTETPVTETVVTTETPAPVVDSTPAPITSLPPDSTTIVAEPAPAIVTTPVQTDRELAPGERARQILEQRTRDGQRWDASSEATDVLLKDLPEIRRVVVREGEVRRAISIQAPSGFILQHAETGLRLNYLYTASTNVPLKELLGIKVRIRGEEGVDPRWPGTPVLLIKALEVLP